MIKSRDRRDQGFSLIELLVVVAIVVVLIGLLIPAIQKVRISSRDTVSRNNLRQMSLAASTYLDSNGVYPGAMTGATSYSGNMDHTGTNFFALFPFMDRNNEYQISTGPTPTSYLYFDGMGGYTTWPISYYNIVTFLPNGNMNFFTVNLPPNAHQSWKVVPPFVSPPLITTFVAPNDPSLGDAVAALEQGSTIDYIYSPVSYVWNIPFLPINVPEDIFNGTSNQLMIFESYASCGSPAGVRAWNQDSTAHLCNSFPPCTPRGSAPAELSLAVPAYNPFQPLWQLAPQTWECKGFQAQSFLPSGTLHVALYDGSVHSITPDIGFDVLNYIAANNKSFQVAPPADW